MPCQNIIAKLPSDSLNYMSSDYKCMKPDKRFYQAAIDANNLDTSRSIMIGDNLESDVKGAISAGLDAYHICKGDLFLH